MDKSKRSMHCTIKNPSFKSEKYLSDAARPKRHHSLMLLMFTASACPLAAEKPSTGEPSQRITIKNKSTLKSSTRPLINNFIRITSPYGSITHSKEQSSRKYFQKILKEIEKIDEDITQQEEKKRRLHTMRDGLYVQVEQLRQGLNEVRDKNYNLRWEIYHQRGAHYMNINGFSLFQGGQMSYEQLLQMEQQMGSVPKGLTEQQIALIPSSIYSQSKKKQSLSEPNQQICCICFDELEQTDEILKISCNHFHHKQCLRDWLLKQRVCPICKQEIIPPDS